MKNIFFVAPEAYSLFKTGGLGDVAYSLTQSFAKLKQSSFLGIPAYSTVLEKIKKKKKLGTLIHPITKVKVDILESSDLKPVKLILFQNHLFENKNNPYVDSGGVEWINNFETFSLFSWAASALIFNQKILKKEIDIIISNDWQTGLVPAYVNLYNQEHKRSIRSAHIIHNIAFPGIFPPHLFQQLGLPNSYFQTEGVEYFGKISFQKAALFFSNKIFTVSPNYAIEISSKPEFGMGFEGLLKHRTNDLMGILNGVDYKIWSPKTDTFIAENYGITTLEKKIHVKKHFLHELKIKNSENKLLCGLVSRISTQKGIDVLIDFFQEQMNHFSELHFIILGTGEKHLCEQLKLMSQKYLNLTFLEIYDEKYAHQIIASSDVFLMPSLFEPCGLTQLYAMKYGTLPLVNPIGGLKDSVCHFNGKNTREATGFYLNSLSVNGIARSLELIQNVYTQNTKWKALQKNAMKKNFSWEESSKQYLHIFNSF